MKNIYNAPNKEVAATELDNLEKKWGGKYPYAILSWSNPEVLVLYFRNISCVSGSVFKRRHTNHCTVAIDSDESVVGSKFSSRMSRCPSYDQPRPPTG